MMPDTQVAHDWLAAIKLLQAQVRGMVSVDRVIRGIHATDASHYQQIPAVVVVPEDEADLCITLRIAHAHRMPVTARGAATSLAGQTFGPGLILDVSRGLNQVVRIDASTREAVVQPGVIRDGLNGLLKAHGLHFAPDPATGNRATIGGMIANNSSGTRSIVYGKTSDHVRSLRVALADGTVLTLEPTSPQNWETRCQGEGIEARIHRGVRQVIQAHAQEIHQRYPDLLRRVSGYNLDAFVPGAGYRGPVGRDPQKRDGDWNLADLIIGSEGTLAIVLQATLRLTPLPLATALCIVSYADPIAALASVERINDHQPSAVELLDRVILREAKINPATRKLADFIVGDPAAMLIVEFAGDDPAQVLARSEALAAHMASEPGTPTATVIAEPAAQQRVWETRKLGLGLISNTPGPVKGQAFMEDACVPVANLPRYIERLIGLCHQNDLNWSMYAHASVGVIHFRPMLDLHDPDQQRLMRDLARQAYQWCVEMGGVFAGEHGDGVVRGQFIRDYFGDALYKAFREIKALFDPAGQLNPGRIIDTPAMIDPALLRYGPHYQRLDPPSRFAFGDQGGLRLAVEQCNGVGACRKLGEGVMCPSFMATRHEQDSTRGRANALRLAISGQLDHDVTAALADDSLHAVLALCLSCRACRSECPNEVDMSRLKAEALQARYDRRSIPLAARLVAAMPRLAPKGCGPLAPLLGHLQHSAPARWLLEKTLGFSRERRLPVPARKGFDRAWRDRKPSTASKRPDRGSVVLFVDTWNRSYTPQVALAAAALLTDLGYAVVPFTQGCCQRAAISTGLLDQARVRGQATLAALDAHVQAGRRVLVLEPSCLSSLCEDLPDLVPDATMARRVADATVLLESFLLGEIATGRVEVCGLACRPTRLLVHGHCHQKAGPGMADTLTLLNMMTGVTAKLVDAGCCGMAGAFGHEHATLSRQIAEDRLLPALRAHDASWTVVTTGFSCRQQVEALTDRPGRHWIELITRQREGAMQDGSDMADGGRGTRQ